MSKIRRMSKIRYELENGEIQLIDIPQELIDKIKKDSYNQALEDLLSKVKSNHYLLNDKINSTDYGMFTCGIEQAINELKR